ncbi:MAG: hypothetical protein EB078_01855, partial [Proteobacteria bacterium]|nr:hypothetical protein [Pseudomonadota bacterium]
MVSRYRRVSSQEQVGYNLKSNLSGKCIKVRHQNNGSSLHQTNSCSTKKAGLFLFEAIDPTQNLYRFRNIHSNRCLD